MPEIIAQLKTARAALTAPGAPFEMIETVVEGRAQKRYRHAFATLPAFLDAGRAHGEREFMVYEGDRWTFGRFYRAADALAHGLRDTLGVKPGDRVAIAMRNRPEWAVGFVAAGLIGAVPAPLNSFGLEAELSDALRTVDARVLICDVDRYTRVVGHLADVDCKAIVVDGDAPAHGAALALGALLENAPEGAVGGVAVAPDDAALILFTSGATSHPKGVLSTHLALCQSLYNLDFIGALAAQTSPNVVKAMMERGFAPTTLTAVPLFHVSGLHAQLLLSLRHGRRLVLMHRWDPARAIDLIKAERITQFSGAPSMLLQVLAEPGFNDPEVLRSLGGLGAGGAGLPQRAIGQLNRLPNMMSGAGFGMTESNGVGAGISGEAFYRQPTSAGMVSPLMELRIADLDGNPLAAGERGEIWLRGAPVMQGYWRNPEGTAQALQDGWLRTGDVGYVDGDGCLFIVDRIKDVINRNGEKIAAAEVESCLLQHPKIMESAVFSLPDDVAGEQVAAVVVPKPSSSLTVAEVDAHVRALLAAYKVPSRIFVRHEALPRNPTGKLRKADLKQQYSS
ncbi:fatty acid--CoA ligase [Pandoraea terrae]|uniref:Fatty acid--CoA ligase n=1 Tax=Pandoraea terrae TaxID=1537710 RepID=A0A5E4YUH8_9BURK|nr:class I adenylate-forming enzyme family protein [Pandoraea terrae]VVE52509.1 fatty acid--CoA ligase [Pandoraea terrae]